MMITIVILIDFLMNTNKTEEDGFTDHHQAEPVTLKITVSNTNDVHNYEDCQIMMITISKVLPSNHHQAEPVTLRITGPPRLDLEPGTRFSRS